MYTSIKSKQDIKAEAIAKYKRISEKKKQQHLKDRKQFLLASRIFFTAFFAVLGLFLIITSIFAKENNITILVANSFIAYGVGVGAGHIIGAEKIFPKITSSEIFNGFMNLGSRY